ncbi:glucan phosphoethanolaminetransferase (alkaline phosphatase superfamily) [Bacillus sp. SLBN-46]|uniref:hypothetical protein n=1 Tax=Bacillus sp. SLBN-46 TaxID=3042283 RepID=UPI0028592347|nr:hypothetical protein [Bacillus sp. SLBN-46]MDR6122857.1 glucan phosphoethanolaminetransferase (alkaline phosphatase superfamily) [Bacillus sp. SLBN-46]
MNRKLVILLSLIYVLFMAALSVYYFTHNVSFKGTVAIGGIICGAVPLLFALFTKLQFNLPIVISYLVFLVGSQYFGSILGWYGLGWWDTFMHFVSGAILAFSGIALYERLIHRNAGDEISPWFVFLFTLSFAALGGVLWEVYEFSSDQFFDMTLQGGGNKDTMTDLIADTIGGLVIAVVAGIRTRAKLKKKT